jgi:L-Ala-D/L-Glu epimerase
LCPIKIASLRTGNKKLMIQLSYKKINLPFTHPFRISKGMKTHQPALIVRLDYFGKTGYGEAPAINYYDITVEKMIEDLESKRTFVEKFSLSDPERYWHYLHHLFPKNPFLVCALDMAAWDIYGKMKKKQLYQLWDLDTTTAPITDFTIGIDSAEVMLKKMKETPWPIYKIKVGFENDMEILETLRKETNAVFRVDANAAWTVEEALHKIPIMKNLGVEFVEQPLAKDDWDGMKILFEKSSLPLIADEACVSEHDVQKCVNHFHGINIKLTKCSGITPARRMIAKARELDLKVMIGCMNESAIGTAAIAQLAPMLDYVDMDGTLLLAENFGNSVSFKEGKIIYNDKLGLGVDVPEWETS